jgi:FkbM family methyltransferase
MILRAVKQIAAKSFQEKTYAIRHGLPQGLKRRGGLGFLARPRPLSVDETFLASIPLHGCTVYDVGCLDGMYTLFFARAVGPDGRVVAFEPNPANYEALVGNVSLNRFNNVDAYNIGLGAASEQAELAVPFGLPGQGTVRADLKIAYMRRAGTVRVPIRIRPLDDMVAVERLQPPDMIKIDVEGYEVQVLQGARRTLQTFTPALFIELHGLEKDDRARNVNDVLHLLSGLGYPPPLHIETGQIVELSSGLTEGHLWFARPRHARPEDLP